MASDLDMYCSVPCLQFLFVGVQLQEELRAARQEASQQHVRELKLDLRTAQLTSAALQKQVRQCQNACSLRVLTSDASRQSQDLSENQVHQHRELTVQSLLQHVG